MNASVVSSSGMMGSAVTHWRIAKTVPAKPVSATASQGVSYEAMDAYVEQQMRRLNIPGVSLAIVEGDQIVHLRGLGRARPGGNPPSPQTPFCIGSLTKSFTALAVMQLVETGKIELDAPIQRYLPWFRVADLQASARMTVRHLLNQTSGLPNSAGELPLADFDNGPGAAERDARALSTLVLAHPVGSAYEYSNSNYILLGLIIEVASGESYPDYMQNHIFIPLGMNHSYTTQTEAKQDGLAVGHQYRFLIPFAVPDLPLPPGALAGGGLICSAEDMARYMIALLNGGRYGDGQLLSGAGIDELFRGAADIRATGLGPAEHFFAKGVSLGQYAMGWCVDTMGQTKLVWHSGTLPDFAAYMALLPEHKKGVVLLVNVCHHWMNPMLTDFGMGVTALLAGQPPAPLPFFRMIPWALRGQLLIPALQMADVAATLRRIRRWQRDPALRPGRGRLWGQHILLPLIPHLLVALSLKSMRGQRRGYLMLYLPDYSWIAMVCGSFSLGWSFLRTGLILRTLRELSSNQTFVGPSSVRRD